MQAIGDAGEHDRRQAGAKSDESPVEQPAKAIETATTARSSRGGDERRAIALTFDDGAGPYAEGPDRAQPAAREGDLLCDRTAGGAISMALTAESRGGHVVGDHTETHPHIGSLAAADQYHEIAAAVRAARGLRTATTGAVPTALRLPTTRRRSPSSSAWHADGALDRRLAGTTAAPASSRSSTPWSAAPSRAR